MIRTVILAALALVCAASNAEARQRHRTYLAHPDCNVTMPCEGVAPSPRGEKIEGCRVRCRSEGLHAARSGPRARRPRFGCHRRPSSRLPLTGLLWLRCCRPGVRGSDPVALVGGELQIPSGRAIGRHGRGSPASCVRARGVSRWRHLAGLRRQFRATSDPHPCPVDRGLCDRQSTGRLGMKLIGWVCLFHGGAAVLVLALAMAVGLL